MADVGRPTKITPEVVEKLEQCFMDGATIHEACNVVKIDRATYYRRLNDDKEFATKMSDAQEYVTEVAKALLTRAITKQNDKETAKWWLERKKKLEFSTRSEVTGADGKDLLPKPILGNVSSNNSDTKAD